MKLLSVVNENKCCFVMSADFGGDSLLEDVGQTVGVGAHKFLGISLQCDIIAVVDFLPCLAHRNVTTLCVEIVSDLLGEVHNLLLVLNVLYLDFLEICHNRFYFKRYAKIMFPRDNSPLINVK